MLQERMNANRWFHSTAQELLTETCRDRPEKTAMVFEEERITFGEQQQVNRLSQAFDFENILTFGVPDPYWGAKIVSLVRLKPGKKLMETKEMRGRCKGKMAEYEIPKEILEWEGPWPMTVVGKMDFKALEKALEERLAGR